ncbi:hypothetical protein MEBOL_006965 [Melittangium boletus DSM 14713]|uniref:Uncharacterized protein n=1 Tax=Melittangium boletus DSM 14713 TaxID=1294270 RepID=A0A250IQL3_9BACT|nr:hypothetical protein MEBOL_006965 [Melittangium boletus DSM 14713]
MHRFARRVRERGITNGVEETWSLSSASDYGAGTAIVIRTGR